MPLVVSPGLGTWGPPVRVGNRPEILDLTLKFDRPEPEIF
jgi:predicted MPP superfamily phosphohydrolase